MSFLVMFAIFAVSYIAQALITGYLLSKQKPEVQPFQQVEQPSGRAIPVLFGTQRLNPVVTWFKGYTTSPVKKKVRTSLFTSTRVTIGYNYKITAQAVLCWGSLNRFVNMVFDETLVLSYQPQVTKVTTGYNLGTHQWNTVDKPRIGGDTVLLWPPKLADSGFIEIFRGGWVEYELYLPALYGGSEKGGGVEGDFAIYFGTGQQKPSAVMQAGFPAAPGGSQVPTYPHLAYVVYDSLTVGTQPSPPPIDFIISRNMGREVLTRVITDPNDPTDANNSSYTIEDVPPPNVIYECLTNPIWGCGLARDLLDPAWYQPAGYGFVCSGEGIGVSLVLNEQNTVGQVIEEMLAVCDGVLRHDPQTGTLGLKLIRDEAGSISQYNGLREFTEAEIITCSWARREWSETINEVTVRYSNAAALWEADTVVVRSEANYAITGNLRTQTLDYPSVTDEVLAKRLAARALWSGSLRLGKGRMVVNRTGWNLERGDVFKLTFGMYGLSGVVCRVTGLDLGMLGDERITVDFVEDHFRYAPPVVQVLPPTTIPLRPNPVPIIPVAPLVTEITTITNALATVELAIFDPQSTVTLVEFQTQAGGAVASGWTTVAAVPYTASVARTAIGASTIAYRVTYDTGNGGTDTVEDEFSWPAVAVSQPTTVYRFDAAGVLLVDVAIPAAMGASVTAVRAYREQFPAIIATDTVAPYSLSVLPAMGLGQQDVLHVEIDVDVVPPGGTVATTETLAYAYPVSRPSPPSGTAGTFVTVWNGSTFELVFTSTGELLTTS